MGRVPSSVTSTQLPGTGSLCWLRKIALGLLTPFSPRSVIGEHTDLVDGAEAVLDGAHQTEAGMRVALEVQHRVHHVLQHARTGQRALLVTWPTSTMATRRWPLAARVRCAAHSRTWATEPGAEANWSE